jgi:hypothetical protein
MSQRVIGIVIDKLLSDQDLRIRFVLDPVETIAALCLRGFELTPDEIEVFMRTDVRVWFWSSSWSADRAH